MPWAKDCHCPWTGLTCRRRPRNRIWHPAHDEIQLTPLVGLFRSSLPRPAMQLPLPWKDTTGVLPVGNGRSRRSNQSECCADFLFRTHLSASHLTTRYVTNVTGAAMTIEPKSMAA